MKDHSKRILWHSEVKEPSKILLYPPDTIPGGTPTIITKTLGTEITPISANLLITHREGSANLFHNSQVYHPQFCLTSNDTPWRMLIFTRDAWLSPAKHSFTSEFRNPGWISRPNNAFDPIYILYPRNTTGRPLTGMIRYFVCYFQEIGYQRFIATQVCRPFKHRQFSHVSSVNNKVHGIAAVPQEKDIFAPPCSQRPSRYYECQVKSVLSACRTILSFPDSRKPNQTRHWLCISKDSGK